MILVSCESCNSYTMGCPPVRGDNPRALASVLSYVQVDKHITILYHLHQCKPCTSRVKGAQWLSGRVLDSRPKGLGFEPHRRHCVVVLEQDTFILA